MRRHRPARAVPLMFVAVIDFATFALLAFEHWVHRQFGAVTLDQIAFHAEVHFGANVHSLFALDPDLTWSGIRNVVLVPAAAAAAVALLRARTLARFGHRRLARTASLLLSVTLLAASAMTAPLLTSASHASDIAPFANEDLFAERYVPPSYVPLHVRRPRNLVVLYVESFEQSYADATAFGRDLIPESTQLQRDNVSFGRFVQAADTGWTMAALVSTMCGVPLKGVGLITYNRFDAFEHFLPGATCLGDILKAHGYRSEFLEGAALGFAGKGRFLGQHGFQVLEGKSEMERENGASTDEDSWRVRDDAVLAAAERHYAHLAAQPRPFVLGVLTADTHTAPDAGMPSAYCARRHVATYSELVSCTDRLVSRFVAWVRAHDPDRRTAIAVFGDHLVMFGDPGGNEAYRVLARKPDRSPFHLFVNPAVSPESSQQPRRFTHFDLFPTLLAAAGFDIPGERLGLGTNLFSARPTLAERYGEAYVDAFGLQPADAAYLALWGLDRPDGG